MMFVIWDNRKNKYLVDIVERLVSQDYFTTVSSNIKKAHQFKDDDKKQLEHFEDLLKYEHGELEYQIYGG
ncbi:hypothetical protein [Lactobacillus acidophilus]|uniref:hypothetical protein n=2 Tax=Lactobacillus acidophilus TaxID=1579 RepID=UPI000F7E829C|nr:hypothetical protein [Lactobacillus acidophilus]